MSEFYWRGDKLKAELKGLTGLRKIRIATAFLSSYGLNLLKEIIEANHITKNHVEIYISPEFSPENPGHLLDELSLLGKVFIVFDIPFHAKVFLLEMENESKLIFGSSNLTKGGIETNIEFDLIKTASKEEINQLSIFFDFCKGNSEPLTDEIINEYKASQKELDELRKIQKQIQEKLFKFHTQYDPISIDDYDISDYYFNYNDYEVLFFRNQHRSDSTIMDQRKALQGKLLNINTFIYNRVKKLKLNHHWRTDNITSLIEPCVFNKGKVGWIGVRYGKFKSEIQSLNKWDGKKTDRKKEEQYGFQKHACLQFSIHKDSFDISLFHAVSHDAVDRNYLHENIIDANFAKELTHEIKSLKGNGFVWNIYDSNTDTYYYFCVDDKNEKDFIDFYKEFDMDGRESFLSYSLKPDDPRLRDIQSISKLILEKLILLLPLYNLVSFRLK